MHIFELRPGADGVALRVASLGSCRVHRPLQALRARGDLRMCDRGLGATHSAAESLQAIRLLRGETHVPDALAPYVFDREKTPSTELLAQTLAGGVEVFLLEVCDDRQFSCGPVLLQHNFVLRKLVQPYRGALLPWYRQVCTSGASDEVCVQTALSNLGEIGVAPSEGMTRLLRDMRLGRADGEEIGREVDEMMAKSGGRWIVVGAITIPGLDGATMRDRRALNGKLEALAAPRGVVFYDPTRLIVDHGRETVLDSGGANLNEYARPFHRTLGEVLVSLARVGAPPAKRGGRSAAGESRPAAGETASKPKSALADRLNRELVDLHRLRLDELGIEGSGLYAHYKARLDQDSLIGDRERFAFDIIDGYLPAYDGYAILRAGLGELALLLAASGRRVIAYEPAATRRAAIEAGRGHLERRGLLAAGRLSEVGALTPAGALEGRVLGVGLDVAHLHTQAAAAPHIENARAFESLLIDLRCFITIHESFADQVALAHTLHAMGFDLRRDYPAESLYWFRRSRRANRIRTP
jgi:hypothetical protein